MLSEYAAQQAAISAVQKMLAGDRVILCDDVLDAIDRDDVATCDNRQRVGILDQFVGWIGKPNAPSDLAFDPATGRAWGTANERRHVNDDAR